MCLYLSYLSHQCACTTPCVSSPVTAGSPTPLSPPSSPLDPLNLPHWDVRSPFTTMLRLSQTPQGCSLWEFQDPPSLRRHLQSLTPVGFSTLQTHPGWMALPPNPNLRAVPSRAVPAAVPSGRRGRGCQPLLMRCGLTAASGGRRLRSRLPGAGVSAPGSPAAAAGKGREGLQGRTPEEMPPSSLRASPIECGEMRSRGWMWRWKKISKSQS